MRLVITNFQTPMSKMKTKINKLAFDQKYYELSMDERISMYRDYCIEMNAYDSLIYEFDEQFFEDCFKDKMEVCRATCFGNVDWNDPYIWFDSYGNLETLTWQKVSKIIEDELDEIFDYPNIWEQYIHF